MPLEVGYILPLLCVPNLDIILHQASREKNCWVKWVEANSSYYCFVSFQLHLQDLFVITISIQIIKIRGHHNLDHLIIASSGDKSTCLTPVHTVDAAIVMVWFFEYNLNALVSALTLVMSNAKWSKNTGANFAELKTLRIGSQDEVLTVIRGKTSGSDGLRVKQHGYLLHLINELRIVLHVVSSHVAILLLDIRNYLYWLVVLVVLVWLKLDFLLRHLLLLLLLFWSFWYVFLLHVKSLHLVVQFLLM